jgi:hypothetical protein
MNWLRFNPFVWWRVRRWRSQDHMDCIMFMGACNLCQERLRFLGLPDNPKPFYAWVPASEPEPDRAPLPEARVVKKTWDSTETVEAIGRELRSGECFDCGAPGHCPHRCQMIGWCHDCDGPDCGGGCRDDRTCPKRMHVLTAGKPPWDLYPDEWSDEAVARTGGRR